MLVYNGLIYTCKYRKSASNNTTAVHVLRHESKSLIFSEKGETRLKKGKKDRKGGESTQKHTRNEEIFCHFWKVHSPTYDYCMHERPE